jgi:hypothetical protein
MSAPADRGGWRHSGIHRARCDPERPPSPVIPAKAGIQYPRSSSSSPPGLPAPGPAAARQTGMTLRAPWHRLSTFNPRRSPLSPLEGEMSASADRGGWRRFPNEPTHCSSERLPTPLCPLPGASPPQGGRGTLRPQFRTSTTSTGLAPGSLAPPLRSPPPRGEGFGGGGTAAPARLRSQGAQPNLCAQPAACAH